MPEGVEMASAPFTEDAGRPSPALFLLVRSAAPRVFAACVWLPCHVTAFRYWLGP